MERKQALTLILAIFFSILVYLLLPNTCPEGGKRAASILTFASILWVFETFPLYVTSLWVIILLTLTLSLPKNLLKGDSGFTTFLNPLGDPIILLFFGGFAMAAALKKYKVDQFLAHKILSKFSGYKYSLLFGVMITSAFIGLWISNTATAVIMFAIIQPFLMNPSINQETKKSLILSIPFTASIAGTATPIASPPNAIAMGLLEQKGVAISFLQWMEICLPLVVIRLVMVALVLIYFFPTLSKVRLKMDPISLDKKGNWVALISAFTIALFITSSWTHIPESIIALSCAALLSMVGLLSREDIRKLDWDILILMWGGLSLGLAIDRSGFGHWLLNLPYFQLRGEMLVIALSILAFLGSSIMSNTATAAIILPLALSIEGENYIMLAVTLTLACSLGLMLPISSPPNAMAFSSGIIKSQDMFKAGLTVDIISLIIILAGFWYVIPTVLRWTS